MSGTRRQRDSLAPSLFPFLAVLLCTMGALVLILMLVVAGAQSSAQQVAQEAQHRLEDTEAQLELARSSYEKQLHEGQLALEKKRLVLQHLEQHIQELLDELDELKRTSQLVEQEQTSDALAAEDRQAAISKLEQQLADAKVELQQKLERPAGDKPIFAIIPYEGANGTHRRPIYLECTETGVVIQPEGIPIALDDLRPPYGPGNPLDAALRTIRAEFPPSNGAVTSTAYPLLVVRPSGIKTYAMARAAMSGWDDQFGYELIDEDLELAFPDSVPGLKQKLVKTLDLARQRQAALVMAMPRKYGRREEEGLGSDFGGGGSDWSSSSGQSGGAFGQAGGSRQAGSTAGGGFSLAGTAGGGPFDERSAGNAQAGFASGAADPAGLTGPVATGGGDMLVATGQGGGAQPTASGYAAADTPLNSQTPLGNSADAAQAGDGDGAAQGGSSSPTGRSTSSGGQGTQPDASSGQQFALPFSAGAGNASQLATANSGAAAGQASANPPNQGDSNNDPSNSAPAGATLSMNHNQHRQAESATPVARQRGRGWAWSRGPRTQSPLVRSIRLQCLSDRWVILPDAGSLREPQTIPFDGTPQQRAEQLAKLIVDRVDSWGLALADGYWQPILVVDVAADAEWRFDQLQQLLDGSGLEVQRRKAAR